MGRWGLCHERQPRGWNEEGIERSESTKKGKYWVQGGWEKCEEKVGISISFGGAQREKHDNRVLKEIMSVLGPGLEYRSELPSQMQTLRGNKTQ